MLVTMTPIIDSFLVYETEASGVANFDANLKFDKCAVPVKITLPTRDSRGMPVCTFPA